MSNVLAAKDPNVDEIYAIDPRAFIIVPIRRSWPYEQGQIGKASTRHTGYYYECTSAGETAYAHPESLGKAWPREEGETLKDGSAEWTARHPSAAGLPTISAVTWEINPAGLSVAQDQTSGGILRPTFSGGAAGESYSVTAHITWSHGATQDLTVAIPVEQQ